VQCFQLMAVEGLPPALFSSTREARRASPSAISASQINWRLIWPWQSSLRVSAYGKTSAAVSAGIQAVLAAGIAVSGSRMGLLMVVLLAAAPLLYRWSVREWSQSCARNGADCPGGYSLGMVLGPLIEAQSSRRIDTSATERCELRDRWVMWTDAVRVTATEPLIGVGVGQYAAAQYWIAPARDTCLERRIRITRFCSCG